ncbi:MAG: hypothetical protein WCT16_02470 [Candidatus Buchananbacteria bacterium]|jgi:hypothetical protein
MIAWAAIRKDGKMFTACRHGRIIQKYAHSAPPGFFLQAEQGFLTDSGEFVDRQAAARIAFECGQTRQLKEILFSEDVIPYCPDC